MRRAGRKFQKLCLVTYNQRYAACLLRAVEQIIGREGETATFLSRYVVTFALRAIGFAPRQINSSVC